MSDRPSDRPAPGWVLLFLTTSALGAGSLALPWTRDDQTGQSHLGWDVVSAGGEHAPVGALLVAAWATALITALHRPIRRVPAAAAAVLVCALCPGYYGWEITRDHGWAIGQDAAGHVVEWMITTTPGIGYHAAGLGAITHLAGVLLRIGQVHRRPAVSVAPVRRLR